MAPSVSQNADERRVAVFLSYSRADRGVAERLRDRLVQDGFDAFLDVKDIVAGEPWQERLAVLISRTDAVVFLISPDSVASEICDWEVNEAERLAKRILPVIGRETPPDVIPGRLKRLNYVFLDRDDKWTSDYPKLCDALREDIRWVREHTRLSELASRWERDGRPDAQLLRLEEVLEARSRLESGRPADRTLGDLLLAFLTASETKEAADRRALLTITGRAFVKPAAEQISAGRFDAALRLGAAGMVLSDDLDGVLVPERAPGAIDAANRQSLRALLHNPAFVSCAKLSADGKKAVVGMWDGRICVWAADRGELLLTLEGHGEHILSVEFSSDGSRILTAGGDHTARVWDAESGAELHVLNHKRPRGQGRTSGSAMFSPDGACILSHFFAAGIKVWDPATGTKIGDLLEPKGRFASGLPTADAVRSTTGVQSLLSMSQSMPSRVAFRNDGKQIVTTHDGGAMVWDVTSGKKLAVMDFGRMTTHTVFSPDGARVLMSTPWAAILWNAASGAKLAELREPDRPAVQGVFSADGARIATASDDGSASVWDGETADLLVSVKGSDAKITHLAFSPDGKRLATGAADGVVRLWDVADGRELASLNGHDAALQSLEFRHDGRAILTSSRDWTARVWDAGGGPKIAVLPECDVAVFSPGGEAIFLAAKEEETLQVWDANEGVRRAVWRETRGRVLSAHFTPDAKRVVTASSGGAVQVWDSASGRELAAFGDSKHFLGQVMVAKDASYVVTASSEGAIRLWDCDRANQVAEMEKTGGEGWFVDAAGGPYYIEGGEYGPAQISNVRTGRLITLTDHGSRLVCASFNRNEALAVIGSYDRTARVWDMASGECLRVLSAHKDVVSDCSFSPDETRILTASIDRTARVWDASTGEEILCLRGHKGRLLNAVFSADGLRIATISKEDGTMRLWDALTGHPLALYHSPELSRVAFNADATRVLVWGARSLAEEADAALFDVERTHWLCGNVGETMAAALVASRGRRTRLERNDLLMQSVAGDDDDLAEALTRRLIADDPKRARAISQKTEGLSRPLHPNSYQASSSLRVAATGGSKLPP